MSCIYHSALTITAAAAKSLQSCPTLCDPIDGSPPGSTVPGILQARTLEWVAICFSNAWKWKVNVTSLSRVWLIATPWTTAYQAPPSIGFSRHKYWSGVPLPSPLEKCKFKWFMIRYYHLSKWLTLKIVTIWSEPMGNRVTHTLPVNRCPGMVWQFLRKN